MTEEMTYGYSEDNSEQFSSMQFGLNDGVARLVKFKFNPNGGKDNAEQDALDIVFDIDGKEVSYRQFPVTKAFLKGGGETTDHRTPEMQKALKEFNATIVHILSVFIQKNTIKTAMAKPIKSFKQYCELAESLLPQDFNTVPLDIFLQWQWQITGDNDKTYLRIPNKVTHGPWLCKAVEPKGSWLSQTSNNRNKALYYVDDDGNEHPFTRSKWFMNSNFSDQQKEEGLGDDSDNANDATAQGTEWEDADTKEEN